MASPFKKKSPLNAYKHSLTSQYVNPRGVIQPIVKTQVYKAIGDASKKVLGELSKNYEDKKLANKINGERLEMSNKSRLEKSAAKPAIEATSKLEYDMNKPSDKSFKNLGRTTIPAKTYNSSQGSDKPSNSSRGSNKNRPQTFKGGIETGKNIGYIPNKEEVVEPERRSVAMMKGSPNKLIEDTMDPYGQPQRGNRDFTFNEKRIAPGTLGNQASVGVQNEIYPGGQAQVAAEQLAAEQLEAPFYSKGHADDYEGHTHRKKGKSYEVGESIDETDFESLNTSLNAYDRGEIQKDKKSQFIVTKNEDYNPTQIDTIRPSKGKQFKMGWGDAERNISTNPKYKKSK